MKLRKLFPCASTLLMLSSIIPSMNINNVSAKRHYYRHHVTRRYRRNHKARKSSRYSLNNIIKFFNYVSRYNNKHDNEYNSRNYKNIVRYVDNHYMYGTSFRHMSNRQKKAMKHASRNLSGQLPTAKAVGM